MTVEHRDVFSRGGVRAVACAVLLVACQKSMAPPVGFGEAAQPETASKPMTPEASTAPVKPALPAFDDRCTVDAECGAIHVHGSGPEACCSMGCAIGKGSKAWVDAVDAACKKTPHPECKDIVCDGPAPPFKPKCKDGHCTLTY
jgi:hypothetical protein